MDHGREARDHFLKESAYRKALANRKEQVEKILSLADVRIGGDREWDITVNDDGFYSRVLRHGSLGLGESYVDGWWDCSALDQLFSRILKAKLDRNAPRDWRLALQWLLAAVFNRQTKLRAKSVAERHYDLGNELYRKMLDGRMVYSCGRWEHASNLDEAQEAKLDFVCRQLRIEPAFTLLDIGCGWGGLAKFAAERYGAKVVGVTVSREQMKWAQQLCRGLPVGSVSRTTATSPEPLTASRLLACLSTSDTKITADSSKLRDGCCVPAASFISLPSGPTALRVPQILGSTNIFFRIRICRRPRNLRQRWRACLSSRIGRTGPATTTGQLWLGLGIFKNTGETWSPPTGSGFIACGSTT